MPKMFYCENKLLFSLFIINQCCKPNIILQKNVLKASKGLLFSLLSYISNTKNVCSKQAGDAF